jgi:hypothetical protein
MSSQNHYIDASSLKPSVKSNQYPDELRENEQWLVVDGNKQPFIPWKEANHWNNREYLASFEQAKQAADVADDYELGFVFFEDDPLVFIDIDNGRDPETGHIDPDVMEVVNRAESYTDISQSGTGLHIILKGHLPEDVNTIQSDIGDDGASIEVYDQARYAIMTGDRLPETPQECSRKQDLIDYLAKEYRSISSNVPDKAIEAPTRSRQEIEHIDRTHDLDVIWDAVKQTKPSDITLDSEITEERPDGTLSRDPSWEHSESGTRIGQLDDGFVYRDGMIGLDPLAMVALEEGIISDPDEYPRESDYWEAVDALRNRGAPIPEYNDNDHDRKELEYRLQSVGELLGCSLTHYRNQARENDLSWPSTDELRKRTCARIEHDLREGNNRVIEAPTASGKTHAVATKPWASDSEMGNTPVLHFSKTREARDEAYKMSQQAGVDPVRLRAGEETCPAAMGHYDDENPITDESLDDLVPKDLSVSEWLSRQTEYKNIPFSRAHNALNQRHKESRGEELPCSKAGGCESATQWDRIASESQVDDRGSPDIIHATHHFAYVAELINDANVVFDERPDFSLDIDDDRLQSAIEAYLAEVGAPVENWENFIYTAIRDEQRSQRHELREAVETDPRDNWYLDHPDAHVIAPAIAMALLDAEKVGNRRYKGTARYQPFYRGGEQNESGIERVEVVLNERYEFEEIKVVPPLSDARCVIGLDAHPTIERWRMNTLPSMTLESVLSESERTRWRRYERGLFVVQVGEADHSFTRSENLYEPKLEALIGELTDRTENLRTAITSKAVESTVEQLLPTRDISPQVLHYGEELSRNDFAGEKIGLLVGCIDPGDDPVLNWLALNDADAEPERSDEPCEKCSGDGCASCLGTGSRRKSGRGFEGPDADLAEKLLESVRETHVAQSIGRYARNADRPDEPTVVFVWTAAIPDELVDWQIEDVRPLTDTQKDVVDYVEENRPVSTREVANELDISKEAARQTLKKLEEDGLVSVDENAGKYGANLYNIQRKVSGFLNFSDLA